MTVAFSAVADSLVLAQETDGHWIGSLKEGNSRSQQYLAKLSLLARIFAKTEHEDWPSSGLDDRAGTEVHPTRARRVAKKREVQFGRPGCSTQLDEGKYLRDRAKTFDVYIATI